MFRFSYIIKKTIFLVFCIFLLGLLYNGIFVDAFEVPAFRKEVLENTIYTSILMGILIAIYDYWIFEKKFSQLPFAVTLFIRSFSYLIIILLTTIFTRLTYFSIISGSNLFSVLESEYFVRYSESFEFLISFPFYFFSFLFFNFIWQLSEMIGQRLFI